MVLFENKHLRQAVLAALCSVVVLGAAACGGDDGGDEGAATAARGADEVAYGGSGGGAEAGEPAPAGEAMDYAGGGSAIPSVGASIIKNADLRLEVPSGEFADAIGDVETVAARYGGFVLSTSLDDASTKRGVVTLRVPSEDFERALRDVKDVGDILGEEISGEDVSQEFIDLEARIRNLEAQQAVFLDLMDRATSISDTITVQNHLSGLQLDIERLQGRLNFLEDRTALGTITVSLVEAGAPTAEDPNVFVTAWHRAIDMLEGIGAGLILVGIGVVLPLGLLVLIGLFLFRQLKPRLTP